MNRFASWIRSNVAAVGLVVAVLVVWEAAVRLLSVEAFILPAPTSVLADLWKERGYLLSNTPATVVETWAGFALALVAGVALAIPIALTSFGGKAIMPLLVAAQAVPKTALAPLFVVWFGFDLTPKVVIAALIAFFPIVVNLAKGLTAVEPELVQYFRTLGASGTKIFVRLRMPNSMPYFFASLKVAVSLATVGAIVGEFIGADSGLGFVILQAINNLDTTIMFAALFMVSLVGIISYGIVGLVERMLFGWQISSGKEVPSTA